MYKWKYDDTLKKIYTDCLVQVGALGSYQFYIIIKIIFLLAEYYSEFIFLTLGFFLIKAFAIPVRLSFFKERPDKEQFRNEFEKVLVSGFPSLHSTRAIFMYLFFIEFFNRNIYIMFFLGFITLIILYSRAYRRRHDPTDIIAGVIFGTIVYFVLKWFL